MIPGMTVARLRALLPLLVMAVLLPGQSGKPQPAGKTGKAAAAPKDDPLTAKDAVILALDKFSKSKVSKKAAEWRSSLQAPPLQTFVSTRDWLWHVDTNKGLLVIRLLPEDAPMHVTNTIYLARAGFYDTLTFPRIEKGFMAQGGSPTNTQSGDAGYRFAGEFLTGRKHDTAGILSAAHSGPGTDSSQLFLTFVPTPHLDGKHTVYGVVTEGLEVLKAIEACAGEPPTETVSIVRTWITVVEKAASKAAAPSTKPPGK